MSELSSYLYKERGYALRSGRASGADSFFERGVPYQAREHSQIFLPNAHFGGEGSCKSYHVTDSICKMEALDIIDRYNIHESWGRIINSRGYSFSVSAHMRNVYQCLGFVGRELVPSKLLVCWTPDGATLTSETKKTTGGTRTAIRIANQFKIPVFNLGKKEDLKRVFLALSASGSKNLPALKKLYSYCKK